MLVGLDAGKIPDIPRVHPYGVERWLDERSYVRIRSVTVVSEVLSVGVLALTKLRIFTVLGVYVVVVNGRFENVWVHLCLCSEIADAICFDEISCFDEVP